MDIGRCVLDDSKAVRAICLADTTGLRFIGILYGAMTAIVGLIAVVVVSSHVVGAMTLEDTRTAAVEMSSVHR